MNLTWIFVVEKTAHAIKAMHEAVEEDIRNRIK